MLQNILQYSIRLFDDLKNDQADEPSQNTTKVELHQKRLELANRKLILFHNNMQYLKRENHHNSHSYNIVLIPEC